MKKYFLAGLVTLLPLAVTVWIVLLVVDFLTKPFVGFVHELLIRTSFFATFTERGTRLTVQLLILFGLFLLILFAGFVARQFFFHRLMAIGDSLLKRIPLVSTVYKTCKEIVQSLFASKKKSFKQVVMLSFPYKGCYCLGIITSSSPDSCAAGTEEQKISVFIPTTPNPTTGFLVMIPKSELIYLNMKSEEAIKYIVSCAVIQPQSEANL